MRFATGGGFAHLPAASRDVVVISTKFIPGDKSAVPVPEEIRLTENSERLLAECGRLLRPNGQLWLYGPPYELSTWGHRLAHLRGEDWAFAFKYWFALDIDDSPRRETLQPSHLGLLLVVKAAVGQRPTPRLELNTDAARTPHLNCAACGKTLKDWGGKKHLMNPQGAAPSDVWRDLPRRKIRDHVIPDDVLARVAAMSLRAGRNGLHVIQTSTPTSAAVSPKGSLKPTVSQGSAAARIEPDTVHHRDCVSLLEQVSKQHPEGLFDLAFADPPYNLAKNYGGYDDERSDEHYLAWCNEWLGGMARSLKPGGSLFVLNLPKWAMHHAAYLNGLLEFRHWIVWDALSDPRGKIMPAHYSLLWYSKPGGKVVCNYYGEHRQKRVSSQSAQESVLPPDSPQYCLRAACVRDRKLRGEDAKVELTDVWFDVHRIKHKRDRDAHPCQLPDKLMERIIKLTTHRGGWVFDPFGGAGTTAIAAAKLGRRFVLTETDENYVAIARAKLAAMQQHADLFGEMIVPRAPIVKKRSGVSKREVEIYLQDLAQRLGRPLTEEDVAADNAPLLVELDALYPNRGAALKRAKVALAKRA